MCGHLYRRLNLGGCVFTCEADFETGQIRFTDQRVGNGLWSLHWPRVSGGLSDEASEDSMTLGSLRPKASGNRRRVRLSLGFGDKTVRRAGASPKPALPEHHHRITPEEGVDGAVGVGPLATQTGFHIAPREG